MKGREARAAMTGKFITFEGGEGAGKTTQIRLLAEYAEKLGHKVVITREPGGTPNGEQIRALLVDGTIDKWDALSEVLLNFAARNEHVKKVIKPALEAGKWVLCDRFFDSTIVYQGYGQGQDVGLIREIQRSVLGNFAPQKTILLDIDIEESLARTQKRGEENRYEKMGVEFHKKIRQGFLKLAKEEKSRFVVVNGADSEGNVHNEIIKHITS